VARRMAINNRAPTIVAVKVNPSQAGCMHRRARTHVKVHALIENMTVALGMYVCSRHHVVQAVVLSFPPEAHRPGRSTKKAHTNPIPPYRSRNRRSPPPAKRVGGGKKVSPLPERRSFLQISRQAYTAILPSRHNQGGFVRQWRIYEQSWFSTPIRPS